MSDNDAFDFRIVIQKICVEQFTAEDRAAFAKVRQSAIKIASAEHCVMSVLLDFALQPRFDQRDQIARLLAFRELNDPHVIKFYKTMPPIRLFIDRSAGTIRGWGSEDSNRRPTMRPFIKSNFEDSQLSVVMDNLACF
jgi:hypothetical protein